MSRHCPSKWGGINSRVEALLTGEAILIGHDWAREAERAARNWRAHYGHACYGTQNEVTITHCPDGLVIRRISKPI